MCLIKKGSFCYWYLKIESEKYARTRLDIHHSTTLPYDIYQLKSRDPIVLKCRHVLDPIYLPIKNSVDILSIRFLKDIIDTW